MFLPEQYELLDFGEGRKLERFGSLLLDRPSPAAEGSPRTRHEMWRRADAVFERQRDQGKWQTHLGRHHTWDVMHGRIRFELKLTNFGHVGLFPEQATNWDWMVEQLARGRHRRDKEPLRLLNLFAYTGGATLAAAAAGAEVTHVDSAKNVVAWARRNAERSRLAEAPIRWIVEDARKFAARESKRGRRYEGVILDPPAFGHGPKGQVWKIEEHLLPLLRDCARLTEGRPQLLLLACHSEGFGKQDLRNVVREAFSEFKPPRIETADLLLQTANSRQLNAGLVLRGTTFQERSNQAPGPS